MPATAMDAQIMTLREMVQAEAHKLWRNRPPRLLTSADLDDMRQDAWIGAIKATRKWNGEGVLSGWAWQWIRGHVLTGIRQREKRHVGKRQPQETELSDSHMPRTPDHHGEVEARIELSRMLDQLTERQRWLFQSYYVHEKTHREMATESGVTADVIFIEMKEIRDTLRLPSAARFARFQ